MRDAVGRTHSSVLLTGKEAWIQFGSDELFVKGFQYQGGTPIPR